jgi:hypothetical protein
VGPVSPRGAVVATLFFSGQAIASLQLVDEGLGSFKICVCRRAIQGYPWNIDYGSGTSFVPSLHYGPERTGSLLETSARRSTDLNDLNRAIAPMLMPIAISANVPGSGTVVKEAELAK